MPEITDEQHREYMELKRKEKIRQQQIDKMIKEGVPKFKQWRKDLKTTRGSAAIFAKVLEREWNERGQPEAYTLDTIKNVMNYLTDDLLVKKGNKIEISKHFRVCLRQYGWAVRLNNRLGLFQVSKIY